MTCPRVFLSVGSPATEQHEEFIRAVEDRLRDAGLEPCTLGRNNFSFEAPLKAVEALMDTCSGAMVLALERTRFERGIEKYGGPDERRISNVRYPTPWNHIEAALACSKDLPLFVLAEHGLHSEGLIEKGYDWRVFWTNIDPTWLRSRDFDGALKAWKDKLASGPSLRRPDVAEEPEDVAELPVGRLLAMMRTRDLWTVAVALASVVAAALGVGVNLAPAFGG